VCRLVFGIAKELNALLRAYRPTATLLEKLFERARILRKVFSTVDIGKLLPLAVVVPSRMEARHGYRDRRERVVRFKSGEATNRGRFVVKDLKNGVQLGDLQ